MRPVVHETTEILYDSLGSGLTHDDELTDWHLLRFLDAVGHLLGAIDDIIRDSEDGVGWSEVFDPDRVQPQHLAFLAQFAGVEFPGGIVDQEKRDYLKATPGFGRGTLLALKGAIATSLIGTKRVAIAERASSAYVLDILTHPDDTPDAAATLAAILSQKPAGLALTYSESTVLTIQGAGGTDPGLSIDEAVGSIDAAAPTWETL
jgi:hypothetical protein